MQQIVAYNISEVNNMENLIKLRKQHGKTQKDIAEFLGISRQAYAHYEIDNRQPDFDTLKRLANYFNVSIDYILDNTDNPRAAIDNDVKVALFGGDGEVTDEMWNEVKQFADFVRAKYKKEKQ